jgi:general secretion pathway protein B
MSFILDALRKSEHERKRNQPPGLADARVHRQSKSRNLWIPLVAILAGINISLLIVMWLTSDEPTVAAQGSPAVAPAASAPGTPASVATMAPQARVTPAETPGVASSSRRLIDELEPNQQPAAASVSAPENPVPASTETTAETRDSNTAESIPSYMEVMLDGSVNLPPLRLDMHVYSDAVDERFVFVNMSKYREGESLSEGPRVTEITTTGVILNHQGRQFLLMRQ